MKYNDLERYNLIQIIQELQTATGLTKTNIKKYLMNFEKIDIDFFNDEYIKDLKRQVFNYKNYLETKRKTIKNKQQLEFIKDFNKFIENNFIMANVSFWESIDAIKELIDKIKKINNIKSIETSITKIINSLDEYAIFLEKNKEVINDNIDILKKGKGFFKTYHNKDSLYYFFFEEKLYCVKLFKTDIETKKIANFSFYVSDSFFNKDIKFFIENYKNFSYFNLEAKKLNDTKTFWLKIGAIIKSYSDEHKVKYFEFSGADDYDSNKPSISSAKYATENSFESCRTYLKANILKVDNSKNIDDESLEIIESLISRKIKLFKEDAFWFNLNYNLINSTIQKKSELLLNLNNIINKSFEQACKDLKFNLNKKKKQEIEILKLDYEKYQKILLNKLESLNFFKKEINIFNTFLKNLNELNILASNIDNNIKKQRLIQLYKILNKINIQNNIFIKAINTIKENGKDINENYNLLIQNINKNFNNELIEPLTTQEEDILEYEFKIKIQTFNYKVLNLISLYIYKNQIIREIRKKNNSKKALSIKDLIKRFEALLNNIIKKYKLNKDIIHELIEIKNSLIPEFENVNFYKVITKEQFGKKLTETLKQVSNIEKTFVLHKDYKNRLEVYLQSIDNKIFKYLINFLNFIEELNFDPQYSNFEFKDLAEQETKVGWLLSLTEEGLFSLINARDKRYYNILINDLGISKDNITFENGGFIFKI